MIARILAAAALLFVTVAPVAAQQQSKGYKFLEAVRQAKGDEVVKFLDEPGQTIVNVRDVTTGDGALHIVIKRGDETYLRYLLSKGADANLRNARGDTPMILAVQYGQPGMIDVLALVKANANLANASGETPLIRAVQRRDLALVRAVLAAGGDPDMTDNVAGQSARDYARQDTRSQVIAKLLDATPKRERRAVSGPQL